MSEIGFLDMFSAWVLETSRSHGIILTILAVIGIFSIVSAVGDKAAKAIKYLFLIFIAIPLIIIVGLFNKDLRKERLKELGEIKAHLKQNPKKMKSILYYTLFCILIAVIVIVIFLAWKHFLNPFYELNQATKLILNNSNISK